MGSQANLLVTLLPVLLPLAILVVPLADLVLAVVRRTRAGRSPFSPDKQHLHHRLLQLGHSHRRAVVIMYLWTAVFAFGAAALVLVSTTAVLSGLGVAAVPLGVVAWLAVAGALPAWRAIVFDYLVPLYARLGHGAGWNVYRAYVWIPLGAGALLSAVAALAVPGMLWCSASQKRV